MVNPKDLDGAHNSSNKFLLIYAPSQESVAELKKLFEENKISEAQEVQKQANHIITILCQIGVMQAEKEVLNQLGFNFGVCRHPFGEPTAEQKELIANEILPCLI